METIDKSARADLSKRFLEIDLLDQRRWYSERSKTLKVRTQIIGISIIAAGGLTTFLQILNDTPWVPLLTAALGVFIAIAEGWQRISRYGETWVSYRAASEKIKREERLFVNGAGSYRNLNEGEAYLAYVEAIENIIAEEQQTYWQARGTSKAAPTTHSTAP